MIRQAPEPISAALDTQTAERQVESQPVAAAVATTKESPVNPEDEEQVWNVFSKFVDEVNLYYSLLPVFSFSC